MTGPTDDPEEGELFSRVYLRSPTSLRDSPRFRKRIYSWFDHRIPQPISEDLYSLIQRELGIEPALYDLSNAYRGLFENGELRDVLDTLTLLYRLLRERGFGAHVKELRAFAIRVFNEESLGYVIDNSGGVRFRVDSEYERNRFSMIDGLGDPRYAAVKHAAESAFKRVDSASHDTKAAVREMFEAVEILAKLATGTREDLNDRMVKIRLKPFVQKLYREPSAQSFADQMLEGLGKWVNAGHRYRHGQPTEEPVAPPLALAVAFLSSGATYLRFLADTDAAIRLVE